MRFGDLYDRALQIGIARDPRGRSRIEQRLALLRRRYDALAPAEKARFDLERLKNPFGDFRIVVGDRDTEFDTVLTGIHILKPEILLAAQLRQTYPNIAIVAHHTTMFAGRALASIEDVVWPLVYRLEMVDVPRARAEELVWGFIRKQEADMRPQLANASTLQVAQALDIPVIVIHTPCDLCYQAELIDIVNACATVGEVVDRLHQLPEYAYSARIGYPVEVLAGESDAPVGKPFYSQGGGWRAPLGIMEAAFTAGARTLFVTQAPPEYVALAQSYGVNLVSVPHDMLDSRGMRLLYDQVFERGITVIPCSNYRHLDHESSW
jgi:hypothetical protein